MFDRCACRAEYSDFASALELFQHAKRVLQFAQGLQGDLGVPAVVVFLGHAQHGQDHVAVDGDIRAVGGNTVELCFDLADEVGAAFLKMTAQAGHSVGKAFNVSFCTERVALTSGVRAALQKHTRSAVPFLPLTNDREYSESRPLRAIALT